MQQESTQELIHGQGHQPFLVLVGGVSPAEGDLAVDERDQPMIGNRDTVRVAAEVAESVLGAAEGTFGIDDPVLAEQLPEPGAERFGIGEELQLSMETESASGEGEFQAGDKFTAKHAAEYFHGKEERVARFDPTGVIGRQAAGRNHAMQV